MNNPRQNGKRIARDGDTVTKAPAKKPKNKQTKKQREPPTPNAVNGSGEG